MHTLSFTVRTSVKNTARVKLSDGHIRVCLVGEKVSTEAVVLKQAVGDDADDANVVVNVELRYDDEKTYDIVVLEVYAKYNNEDVGSWDVMHLLGCGSATIESITTSSKSTEASIISEYGVVEGMWYITNQCDSGKIKYGIEQKMQRRKKEAVEASDRFCNVYTQKKPSSMHRLFRNNPTNDNEEVPSFCSLMYRGEKVPLPVVLANLCYISTTSTNFEALMFWWLTLSKSNCGITTTVDSKIDMDTFGEVVGELFTMPMKGMIYTHDKCFSEKVLHDEDQWISAFSIALLQIAAFDCEDGTIAVMQLVHAFNKATFENQELSYIQRVLKSTYAVCLFLGQLKVDDSYVYHAYPVFLDKQWFNDTKQKDIRLCPTLVLESTNYTASVFSKKQLAKHHLGEMYSAADMAFVDAEKPPTETPSKNEKKDESVGSWLVNKLKPTPSINVVEEKYRLAMHLKAPVCLIKKAEVYGLVHTIYTCESDRCTGDTRLSVYHPVLTEQTSNNKDAVVVGVDNALIFENNKKQVTLKHCVDVTTKDLMDMEVLLYKTAPIVLPNLPAKQTKDTPKAVSSETHVRYIVKDVDGSDFAALACAEVRNTFPHRQMRVQKVDLFQHCPMLFIDVEV